MERLYYRKKEMMCGIDVDTFQEMLLLKEKEDVSMDVLFEYFSRLCETSERPIVLMIDEVDSASGNQVFLDFLALETSTTSEGKNC